VKDESARIFRAEGHMVFIVDEFTVSPSYTVNIYHREKWIF
jgi:hypothetical protein